MQKQLMEKYNVISLFFTAVISLFEIRVIYYIHNEKLGYLAHAANAVLTGKTQWEGFQNRLLGPYLLKIADGITNNVHTSSYFLFLCVMIAATNIILFFLFLKLCGDRTISLKYILYFSASFTALQDYTFLYTWDLISLLVFSVFSYAVFKKKGIMLFVALFFIELFNREDAVYIAAWIFIDSFEYFCEDRFNVRLVNVYKAITGAVLMTVGFAYIVKIRNILWLGGTTAGDNRVLSGNTNVFLQNIKLLLSNFFSLNIMISALILYVIYYFYKNRRVLPDQYYKIYLVFLCMFVSSFVFGNINETRIWFIFIPLYLMSKISLESREDKYLKI
jgi:hypothetical protein